MCDKRLGGKITNNEVLCEHYFCSLWGILIITTLHPLFFMFGQCTDECENTDLNKVGCNDEKVALPTGELVRPSDICNDVCDMGFCEDEANCNGHRYGKYCMSDKKLFFVSPKLQCDGYQHCDDGEDEEECTVTSDTETFCKHDTTGEIVPVHNYTRCMPVKKSDYALDFYGRYCIIDEIPLYQTNCSDPEKIALTCEMK